MSPVATIADVPAGTGRYDAAPHARDRRNGPFDALDQLLDGLRHVILEMPEEAYVAIPMPGVSGSIGGHVRHTLDHIAAFAAAHPTVPLNYDRRERGTAVETDPAAALDAIAHLSILLSARSPQSIAHPVAVTSMVTASGESVTGWSTMARELAFVVSHTVHHQAMIAVLLSLQGLGAPTWFGYSPSTPRRAED